MQECDGGAGIESRLHVNLLKIIKVQPMKQHASSRLV